MQVTSCGDMVAALNICIVPISACMPAPASTTVSAPGDDCPIGRFGTPGSAGSPGRPGRTGRGSAADATPPPPTVLIPTAVAATAAAPTAEVRKNDRRPTLRLVSGATPSSFILVSVLRLRVHWTVHDGPRPTI